MHQQRDDSNFARRTPVLHILLASKAVQLHEHVHDNVNVHVDVDLDVHVLVDVGGL